MTASRAPDVFVRCLEAEGVRRVFGIPGEETLDLNHSLAHSSMQCELGEETVSRT